MLFSLSIAFNRDYLKIPIKRSLKKPTWVLTQIDNKIKSFAPVRSKTLYFIYCLLS